MNDLKIFKNKEFGQVRTIEIDGKPYFMGSDIAKALGYSRPNDAIKQHCRATVKHRTPIGGKMQEVNFIGEGDMYRLITHSKLESAERFESWVFDDVLPTLRKTGSYEMPKKKEKPDRTEIMLMNARSRMAQTYLKLANVNTLSSTYKTILVAKASQVLSGEELIPLPESKRKVYSAGEIGEMFGISANKVGRIANKHNLKADQFGEYRRSKSEHSAKEIDTWVYFDTVIPVIEKILGQEVA